MRSAATFAMIGLLCIKASTVSLHAAASDESLLVAARNAHDGATRAAILRKLERLQTNSNERLRTLAQLAMASLERDSAQYLEAITHAEGVRSAFESPHIWWCEASLILADIALAQVRLADAAILAEDVAARGPEGAITYRAAVLAGDIAQMDDRMADAATQWRWADALAKRLWYADVPEGIDRDAAARRLRDLESRLALVGMSPDEVTFAAAERLRQSERWLDAASAYAGYRKDFPTGKQLPKASWAEYHCRFRAGEFIAARQGWEAFIAADPAGDWRGSSWLGLVDLDLQAEGDLTRARRTIDGALTILRQQAPVADSDWWEAGRALYVRCAMLAWLDQDRASALAALECAQAYHGPADESLPGPSVGAAAIPGGLARLHQAIEDGHILLPTPVASKSQGVTTIALAWAEMTLLDWRYDEAAWTFQRIAEDRMPATVEQRAHAWLKLAHCRYGQYDFKAALSCYEKIFADYQRSTTAPQALLCQGTLLCGPLAQPAEGLAVFADLIERYPRSEQAATAGWYIGQVHFHAGRWQAAIAAWRALLRQHPKSCWRTCIEAEYLPACEKHLQAGQPIPEHP